MSALQRPKAWSLASAAAWHLRLIRFPEILRHQDQTGRCQTQEQSGDHGDTDASPTGWRRGLPTYLCSHLSSEKAARFCIHEQRPFLPNVELIQCLTVAAADPLNFCLFWREHLCATTACIHGHYLPPQIILKLMCHFFGSISTCPEHICKAPSLCHNTCKSEVFMTLNTRGENCGLLCDSVIAQQSVQVVFLYIHTYAVKGSSGSEVKMRRVLWI